MQAERPSKTDMVLNLIKKARSAACMSAMWRGGKSADDRAAEAKLMAGEDLQNLIRKSRQEIDQLNRDYEASKVRILTMKRNGVDKMKIIPHMQTLKRMENRINQKNKLLQNVEASADTANDAELVIESAKAQKQMLDIQKHTLARAFKGTDVEDLVDDLQDHHEDITEINEALSGMQLGGGTEEITEEDFDEWFKENETDAEEIAMGGGALGIGMEGSHSSFGVVELPGVPAGSKAVLDRAPAHSAAGSRARKPKVAQFAL